MQLRTLLAALLPVAVFVAGPVYFEVRGSNLALAMIWNAVLALSVGIVLLAARQHFQPRPYLDLLRRPGTVLRFAFSLGLVLSVVVAGIVYTAVVHAISIGVVLAWNLAMVAAIVVAVVVARR